MGDLFKRDEHGRLTGPPDAREMRRDLDDVHRVRREAINKLRARYGQPPLPKGDHGDEH